MERWLANFRVANRAEPLHGLLPAVLCLPLAVLACTLARYAVLLPWQAALLLQGETQCLVAFLEQGGAGLLATLAAACAACAALMLVASLAGLARRPWTLWLLRKCYGAAYVLGLFYAYVVLQATRATFEVMAASGQQVDAVDLAVMRWHYLWPAGLAVLVLAALHVTSWRRVAVAVYAGPLPAEPLVGDRIVENLRTHGSDPRYRKSLLASIATHIVVLVAPLLLQLYGCVHRYLVPHGSGRPMVAVVQMVERKKRNRKRKRLVLNPNSAIYFHVPDLDESEILKQVEEMTQLTYVADPNARAGKMGAGGGSEGGWPEGVGREPIRFIRMEYNGRDWDDGMNPKTTKAAVNFLQELHRLTGFKVARRSESHAIPQLAKYPKGSAPLFVYMTGADEIHIPQGHLRVLREYLLDSGMLLADCGSRHWDRSFRGFVKQLFPDKRLVVIADDDPIFQMPYAFPNGAPPLWHHGGTKALGIKHKGRWAVFYHPGDINDAWKTGHSGLRPELAKGAFQMGVNIIYYAFTHYLHETRRYRK